MVEAEGRDEDAVMMDALECGAADFSREGEVFEIYTLPADFSAVREKLEEMGYSFLQAEIQMVPQNYITLTDEKDRTSMRRLLTRWRKMTTSSRSGTTGRMRTRSNPVPRYAAAAKAAAAFLCKKIEWAWDFSRPRRVFPNESAFKETEVRAVTDETFRRYVEQYADTVFRVAFTLCATGPTPRT